MEAAPKSSGLWGEGVNWGKGEAKTQSHLGLLSLKPADPPFTPGIHWQCIYSVPSPGDTAMGLQAL